MTLCGKECVSHSAADQEIVDIVHQVTNDSDFVRNFRSPENRR